jgi:protein involved in polysaccharide export with SLBB domain
MTMLRLLPIWLAMLAATPSFAAQLAHPLDQAAAQAPRPGEYLIGPGDELAVVFPFNAELNTDGPVGPDGRFSLPFAGSLDLAGETVGQASALISTALQQRGIVADAHASVSVRRYAANVYIGGEVRLPGLISLSPGMDALQAVIAAGGLLDTARTKHIAIIRRAPDGRAIITYVNLRDYTHGIAASKIDQYLNKLLPFGKSLNYGLGSYTTTTLAK